MARIKYKCKKCNSWETSIIEEWADLKPKKCMNKKCKTSFLLNPEMLEVILPEKQELETKNEDKKKSKKSSIE